VKRLAVKRLVLLGGGHSHVAVLKSHGETPIADTNLTLVSAKRHTPYSGMLPGLIAGHYTFAQSHIDLARLAGYARAGFVEMEAVALNAGEQSLFLADGSRVEYDVLSIDIGSTPPAFGIPGVPEHVIPAKPIEILLPGWEGLRARAARLKRVALVGAGAAGVELVLAMQYQLGRDRAVPGFDLISDTPCILPGHNVNARRRLQRILDERGVRVHTGRKVAAVEPGRVVLEGGASVDADAVFWVTGAAPAAWLRTSALQTDAAGFIAVNPCLQSLSHAEIFAAGDCASVLDQPRPKSGVFAVRQGMPLCRNLRHALAGRPLEPYVSPPHALALISAGGKYAVATRNDWALEGGWVWLWKDWIDRRFVRTYQRASRA
jgi:selenide,water dikinase